MNQSLNEDLGIVNEQLGSALSDVESIKQRLAICQLLAEKQAEEIEAFTKMKKRLRTLSYIELGVGVPCLVMGFLPIWTNEQQNIKNLFLGIGGTATSAGVLTFTFTITF